MARKRKKMLHILKTQPDEMQKNLMCTLSLGYEILQVALFEDDVDYDELVDLIFDYDQVITWW